MKKFILVALMAVSGLSTFVQEAFSGIRVIKAFAKEQSSAKEFDKLSNEYRDESLKLTKINAYFFPVISTLIGLSTILTVYIGGNEVIKGNITIGNIAEFIIYVNILTWPVTSLGWITSLIQQAAASQSRINEFLDTESEIIDGNIKHEIKGDISFKNVSLTYSESGIEALKDISFDIKKGETLAILGRTGCGKSTLANLLNRMIDPTEGEIYIDNKKLTDLKLENYRSQLGVVPQESFLFSDTIQNNILFGNQNLTHADMIKASIDADLHENVLNFTDQ